MLLASCGIADWHSINALSTLPRLRDLRLSGNPVLHFSRLGSRAECIGRVARLTRLNGAGVSGHERRDCELRYLRDTAQRLADLGADAEAERPLHPRLGELAERYGQPDVSAAQAQGPAGSTLGAQLLSVDVVCPGACQRVQGARVRTFRAGSHAAATAFPKSACTPACQSFGAGILHANLSNQKSNVLAES